MIKTVVVSLLSFISGLAVYHFFLLENTQEPSSNTSVFEHPAADVSQQNVIIYKEQIDNNVQENARGSNVETHESTSQPDTETGIFEPTDEEIALHRIDFEIALDEFYQQTIDYDWADEIETRFIDLMLSAPASLRQSFVGFSCHETKCLLSIVETEYMKDWAPFIGQAGEQPWWDLGRIHFHPRPKPDAIDNYTLVFDRVEKASSSE